TGYGIKECARLLKQRMEKTGIRSRVIKTGLHPVVYGEIRSKKSTRTMLLGAHYDVQPVEPVARWSFEPFGATVKDGRIYGRGATDCKGNVVALLKATEALLKVRGDVPLNIKFFFDGEEEIISPSLPQFLKENKKLLQADTVLYFDGGLDFSGNIELKYGNRGTMFIELRSKTAGKRIPAKYSNLVEGSLWRMINALKTIRDEKGNVLIDGFYKKVRVPTERDMEVIRSSSNSMLPEKKLYREWGIKAFIGGISGTEAAKSLFYNPAINISGMSSGYAEEGFLAIIPDETVVKMDIWLVPDQDPREVLKMLKIHLQKHGFGDIEVKEVYVGEPCQCSWETDVTRACIEAAGEVYGSKPNIIPVTPGFGRHGPWISKRLGIRTGVHTGIGGPMPCNQHEADEFIEIGTFIKGIKFAAAAIVSYAQQ
ncbi:MAG: M20/M25/M40 family metallo-hydrolase, partial [Nitrospirae bacterium]|nr:M20/M25/M40 family metallo-hydrolase [Nitrospirota bacterium]